MGLRGPGAARRRAAREKLPKRKRKFPWLEKGLSRVDRVIAFLEFVPITKGPLTGQKMKLLPDQLEFVQEVYGNLDSKGLRKRRLCIKSEPKGNGKTGLAAALCACHLLGPEAEARGEIYSAAINRQQAAIIFNEMEAIIFAVPEFADIANPVRFHKRIEVLEGPYKGSIYEALSVDARGAHGLAPSLFVYDELAQAKDRVLLDNLVNGLGKRKEALGIVISTQAPSDDHPLSQLIDDGLSGTDPSVYVQLTCADQSADPFLEETWRACNPALGIFLSLEEMRSSADRAQRIPAFEPAFRNLRLNQRVDANEEDRLVTHRVWAALGEKPIDRGNLKGRMCFAALDLSGKHDLTSLTLAFPDDNEKEPSYDLLPFFWTPHGQLDARRPAERDRFRQWIREGYMETCPGPTIRFSFVAKSLIALAEEFKINVIGYDRYRIDDFKQDLANEDPNFPVPLESVNQGAVAMEPAIQWFAELALTGRIRHGGHPVLMSCMSNAILSQDSNGNHRIDKDKSEGRGPVRIDGAVTTVMALHLAKNFIGEKKPTYQFMVF